MHEHIRGLSSGTLVDIARTFALARIYAPGCEKGCTYRVAAYGQRLSATLPVE